MVWVISFVLTEVELDETKIVLHKTIESVLERGENVSLDIFLIGGRG